jgi:dienelactone hydrolase
MTFRHAAAAALTLIAAPAPAAPTAIRLVASDRLVVSGTFFPVASPKATVLLFHQAGSGKGEYAAIGPRLAAAGYEVLAIDQRVGGSMFGANATAARARGEPSYVDAQKDLEAAFAWAERRHRKIVLWGSSYSAALVFRVAAAHPGRVAAVLAFSPGEYLDGRPAVAQSARRVDAPVFVTSASTPAEIAAARTILAAVRSPAKVQYVPKAGVHGSSTLIADRNPAGARAAWVAVRSFLAKVVP